jgi:hypothetical protein
LTDDLAARMADAEQAKQAMERWLSPAFDVVLADYLGRLDQLASTTPWDDKRITKVAMGVAIAKQVRRQIEAVIADGSIARAEYAHSKQIEAIHPERRKILGGLF